MTRARDQLGAVLQISPEEVAFAIHELLGAADLSVDTDSKDLIARCLALQQQVATAQAEAKSAREARHHAMAECIVLIQSCMYGFVLVFL